MIRPVTCVCMLLAGASGLYLYQAKHRVQLLDRQIENTVRAAQATRERTGVVKAEWTLLNDPERLNQLAGRFLTLKTVTPGQFTTMAELDNRLPPVRVPDEKPSDQSPLESPQEPIVQAPEPSPAVIAAAPKAGTPEKTAEKTAEKPVEKTTPAKVAAAPARTEHAPERTAERKRHEPAQVAAAATPAAPPRMATRSVIGHVVAETLPRPVPVASYAPLPGSERFAAATRARPAPAEPAAPVTTSALGMTRVPLAAPVPVANGGYNPMNGN